MFASTVRYFNRTTVIQIALRLSMLYVVLIEQLLFGEHCIYLYCTLFLSINYYQKSIMFVSAVNCFNRITVIYWIAISTQTKSYNLMRIQLFYSL